jgi:hypothetical protein
MTSRSLSFVSLTVSLFFGCSVDSPLLIAANSDQTPPSVAKPDNQEPPAKPTASASVEGKLATPASETKMLTPFVLKGLFRNLPAKSPEEVQVIEGLGVFQKKAEAEELTAWPIAKFATAKMLKDEAGFCRALRAHAAKLGADYVVIMTDQEEIKQIFQPRFEKLVYCALAYKRVTALLGIDRDEAAAKEDVMRIRGFMRGAKAEQSGLRVGDIVKKVDGVAPEDRERYWSKAVRWKAGDKVKVEIEREGKPMEFEVELTAG